jgi:hypothetical protein
MVIFCSGLIFLVFLSFAEVEVPTVAGVCSDVTSVVQPHPFPRREFVQPLKIHEIPKGNP